MKNILSILLLLASFHLFSQSRNSGATYAVVVGISDYQDSEIPDLKYAHKDAEAFANFLRSPAGGELDDNHLKLLINEQASIGQMVASLDWLLEVCKEGDQAIVYFSGHGDVEQKTKFQLGFLLPWDSPAKSYAAGAFHLYYLEAIISTLSLENKAKVIMITDACRSGKLAGSAINGSQLTSANLAKQFGNEIKILSCQPNEYSIEGKQWGGGRGAFSYHLINGLYGQADSDDNLQVNLMEIGRYLDDNVTAEVAPLSQIPMTIGNRSEKLVNVYPEMLSQIRDGINEPTFGFASIETKGIEELSLENVSPNLLKLYQDFKKALDEKYLLSSDKTDQQLAGKSATELYDILSKESQVEPLHNLMKRNFAAALQDEAQQAILAYLKTDPEEMKKRYDNFGADYESYPAYLAKSIELLGPGHYMYKNLLAKQYYFEGLLYRLKAERDEDTPLLDKALEYLEMALHNDNQAAYIFNEMGLIKQRIGIYKFESTDYTNKNRLYRESIALLDSALLKAPSWVLPHLNMGINFRMLRWMEKSDSMYYRVLELDSSYYWVCGSLGLNLSIQNKDEAAIEMYKKVLEHEPDHEESHTKLANIYSDVGKNDLAKQHFDKAIAANPSYFYGQNGLGHYYSNLSQHENAILQFKTSSSLRPKELGPHWSLAYEYMYIGQFQKARESIEVVNTLKPGYFEYHFGLSCWHALQGQVGEGLIELEKAIKAGLRYDRIPNDSDIDSLRDKEEYKFLMEKYFPEKVKK